MENNDFQRIKRVMQVKEIPSFAAFSRQIGLPTPQNFTDLKRGKYKIARNFAQKIHDIYPDISIAWLMTGEGGMYIGHPEDNHGDIHHNNVGGDLFGNGASKQVQTNLTAIIESQQATIRDQAETIKRLTTLLTSK